MLYYKVMSIRSTNIYIWRYIMTISFALLNEQGIVVAADPAIKNKFGVYTENRSKIIEITPNHSICIIVYNNYNYYNVSLESIVQLYRTEMNGVYFDHTNIYFNDFINFVGEKLFKSFNLNGQEEKFIQNIITEKLKQLENFLIDTEGMVIEKYHLTSQNKITEAVLAYGEKSLDIELRELEKKVFLEGFSGDDELDLVGKYEDYIINYVKNEFIYFEESWLYKVVSIIVQHLLKTLSHDKIGIAVAGYGKKDLFPSIYKIEFDGKVNGKLRYDDYVPMQISVDNPATALVLTNTKKISNIISGIDQELEEELYKTLTKNTSLHMNKLLKKLQEIAPENNEIYSMLNYETRKFMYGLKDNVEKIKVNHYNKPFMELLNNRSVDELTYIAELLMHAELFGNEMTSDFDRNDVLYNIASITKTDNFVRRRMNE